ncbi:MAG: sulfite exporter TauE/SafE family protein [Acidocella sp.]|nr:sulfite exporter TauE/SafE family protein [Acidocella sp.]
MHLLGVINPLYVVSGLCVGLLVGLTGVGGGSLMTPLLILVLGIQPATAVGTDLLYAAITKSVGTGVNGFNRRIDWRIVGRLATGSMPATILTILAMGYCGDTGTSAARLISLVLGAALIITAATLVFKKQILALAIRRNPDFGQHSSLVLTIITGIIIGVLVSISSVGAGALGTTALMFLYPRLSTAKIIAADIAHAVPLTLVAGIGHWWLGGVNFAILIALLCGSIPGIIIGSMSTQFIPDGLLRPVLALVLFLVALRLLFET